MREQSGIQAGAGGFQLDVKGHTQLDGGAIASTAAPDRNVLRTGRLGYTELDEQKVRERLEMGQVAGEVGFTAAADLAGRLGLKEGRKHSCAV